MKKYFKELFQNTMRGRKMRSHLSVSLFAFSVIAVCMFVLAPVQAGVLCAGIGLMGFIDEKSLDEDQKKTFEGLDNALEKALQSYIKDDITVKEFNKQVSEIMKEIKTINEEKLGETIDKKTFDAFKKDVLDGLAKLKSASEVKPDGAVGLKSLEDQILDQLKDYATEVTVDGVKGWRVDLSDPCSKKMAINVILSQKEATPTTTAGAVYSAGVTIEPGISTAPRAESEIRQYANVASIATRMVVYTQMKDIVGDAEWVPEGGLKPSMHATIEEVSITAGKVALMATMTEETTFDLPQLVAEIRAEIINRVGDAEEEGIMFGSGTNGEIKGVFTNIPEYTLTGLKVKEPNYFDAIVAAYTQVVSVSKMNYAPNLVRVHPVDLANMKLTKDKNGQYLFPPFSLQDGTLIAGVQIKPSNKVDLGSFQIGDFRYLNIRDYMGLTLKFGFATGDFEKNRVSVIGEKRLLAYIKSNYLTAFVKGEYTTILEAIDEAKP